MDSFGLSSEDARDRDQLLRVENLRMKNQGYTWKMAFNMVRIKE